MTKLELICAFLSHEDVPNDTRVVMRSTDGWVWNIESTEAFHQGTDDEIIILSDGPQA